MSRTTAARKVRAGCFAAIALAAMLTSCSGRAEVGDAQSAAPTTSMTSTEAAPPPESISTDAEDTAGSSRLPIEQWLHYRSYSSDEFSEGVAVADKALAEKAEEFYLALTESGMALDALPTDGESVPAAPPRKENSAYSKRLDEGFRRRNVSVKISGSYELTFPDGRSIGYQSSRYRAGGQWYSRDAADDTEFRRALNLYLLRYSRFRIEYEGEEYPGQLEAINAAIYGMK